VSNRKDLTGQKFGRLTVIRFSHMSEKSESYWICECDCGNKEVRPIKGKYLKNGGTKSCGCLSLENTINLIEKSRNTGKRGIRMSNNEYPYKEKLKNVWGSMKERCYNPNSNSYKWYGEKGVKIYSEWLDRKLGFFNFYNWAINNGYKEGLTIDRVDYDGNYEPSNCEWVTPIIQSNNTCRNIKINIRNKTQTLAEWAREYNLPYRLVLNRYNHGVIGKDLIEPLLDIESKKGIEVNGIIHTGKEWAEIIGIDFKSFKKKYDNGIRGLELTTKLHNDSIVTELKGELLTLHQISEIYNININTLRNRFKIGLRGEDLIQPLQYHVITTTF